MKKWENPKLQNLSLYRTEAYGIKCVTHSYARVSEVLCYKCDCCGTEFHTTNYGGNSELAKAKAVEHELTCGQCLTS